MTAVFPPALILLAGAALLVLAPRRLRPVFVVGAPLIALAYLAQLGEGTVLTATVFGADLQPLRVDPLSTAFGVIFALMGVLAGVYGLRVMGRAEAAAALVYAGSGLGAVFAGDLVTLFVFWEVKALGSALLIWSPGGARAAGAGMRYLFVHLFGGTALLGGVLWHFSETGSLAFTAFDPSPATTLILLAFALSAAVPPLHAWLADAYPEASVAGTVFLSAFTTKAAVYALARGFAGYELLVWFGVAMALYGVVYAVLENDIRRLLAYHIVSQVGYMVAAVGLGTPAAIDGATAHAFAHILYKGLLLMGAGAVVYATGKNKLTELGGLAGKMPLVVVLYMVGAFSISGVPLFSGFVSKELVVEAASAQGREAVFYLLKLASVGTFLHTGLKLPYFTWFGPRRNLSPGPVPTSMILAMAAAATLNVVIGVQPGLLYELLPSGMDYQPYTTAKVVDTVQLLVFTGLGFWLLAAKLGGEPTVTLDTDWVYRRLPGVMSAALPVSAAAVARMGDPVRQGLRRPAQPPRWASRVWPTASAGRPASLWVFGTVIVSVALVLLMIGVMP